MKKIFLAVLCVCMLVCFFPMSAGAERIVGKEEGNLSDGVGNFVDAVGSGTDIKVAVVDTENRYAVDVTFPPMNIVFGTIAWNVNTFTYDIDLNNLPTEFLEVQVTNHSDKPVIVHGSFEKANDWDLLDISYSSAAKTIPAVMPGATSAQTGSLNLYVKPQAGYTWSDVLTNLFGGNIFGTNCSYTVGTLSVFVEAAPEA